MLEIADQKSVKGLGYIGGVMGPKEFTDSKSYVVQMLCSSKHKISYVELFCMETDAMISCLARTNCLFCASFFHSCSFLL